MCKGVLSHLSDVWSCFQLHLYSDLDPDPESLKLELKIRAVPLMYKISDALVRYCPMSKCPSDEMTAGRQLAALLAASAFLRA